MLSGWNVMRRVRLFLGAAVAVQGIAQNELLFFLAGTMLVTGALLHIGCCGTGTCSTPRSKNSSR